MVSCAALFLGSYTSFSENACDLVGIMLVTSKGNEIYVASCSKLYVTVFDILQFDHFKKLCMFT